MNTMEQPATMVAPNALQDSGGLAVVVPCYRVADHVVDVVRGLLPHCDRVYVVDDCCPQGSGRLVADAALGDRVRVLFNPVNLGVGGAVMAGYAAAVADGAEVIVKVDGDGQMDPSLIAEYVRPILDGEADYAKGNRFFDISRIGAMPPVRIFGNAALSFAAKLSTGYWDLFDPTNGFTAIHADVARRLPFERISQRYFFETDMLFRLNSLRAVVVDVPMHARYGDEVSNLRISRIFGEFLGKHLRNTGKRIFYNYFLRDFSLASLELLGGLALLAFAGVFGTFHWLSSWREGVSTPVGTIMIVAISAIWGMQLLLAFVGHDIGSVPRRPIHRRPAASRVERTRPLPG
jgi:glycosyltransferase involved in cell wall biosynthesis